MKKTSFEKIKEEKVLKNNKHLKTSYELGKDYFDKTKNSVEFSEELLNKDCTNK